MKKRMQAVLSVCFGVGLALIPHTSYAQAVYGSVYGNVTDASGAAIPGASITVTDEAKGTSVTAKSNESGGYSVEHLIPDSYTIRVEAAGFKIFETQHLIVQADTAPKVDAAMQTGGASETVSVNADTVPDLKTDRADVSTVFNARSTQDLPIGGRNFTSLQLLLPGTQLLGWSHAASENPQASQQIIVNGQHFAGTAYELDGTDNQDPILGIIVVNPALDAVSQAKITTQNYDAEFGKAVSAVITAQTKSGSNSVHGSGFIYRQNDGWQARDPFVNYQRNAITGRFLPPSVYSQFGGSIGGPIIKDKLFFFGDYQGLRQKLGSSFNQTVPTAQVRSSCLSGAGCDFSQYIGNAQRGSGIIYDPLTDRIDPTDPTMKRHIQDPFPGNVIPANRLSPSAINLLKLIPDPLNGSLYNNFPATGNGIFNNDQFDVRGDWQANGKTHVFGRYSYFKDTLTGGTAFGSAGGQGFGIGGYGGTSNGKNQSVATGADIAINPTLLTDFRLGYFRYTIGTSKYDGTETFATNNGLPGLNFGDNFTGGAPGFFVNDTANNNGDGLSNFGSGLGVNRCNCPLVEQEDQYQIVNNWTKVLGNHSIKFGGDIRYARNLRVPSDSNRAGELTYGSTRTAGPGQDGGVGLATFLLGDVTGFSRYVSTSTNAKEFQKRTFFYVQDTWHPTANLTVNYGVRWEIYFPEAVNGKGQGGLLDLSTGNVRVAGFGPIGTNLNVDKDFTAFAPRIGIAYQLNPKTVIRTGYGRSFDIGVFGSIFGHTLSQNLPVLARQNLNNAGGTTAAFQQDAGPTPFSFAPYTPNAQGLIPLPDGVNGRARPTKIILPTIDAWNLSIQRTLTPTMSLTVAYVGNKGTHTFAGDNPDTNPNQPTIVGFTPGSNSNLRRRYFADRGWTQDIVYFHNGADTHYNALQATLDKRFAQGLQFTANYAWQRAFNYAQDYFEVDKYQNYGRIDDLREQQFTMYGNYELPFGRNHMFASGSPAIVNAIIGGWQLNGTMNWSSGLPFTPGYGECGSDRDTGPCRPGKGVGQLPLQASSLVTPANGNPYRQYFTPVAPLTGPPGSASGPFVRPEVGTFGSIGRNTFFGPNFFNTDMGIQKSVPLGSERVQGQFRFDAFNVFNHINPANPGNQTIDGGGNAGQITQQAIGGNARYLRMSLRLTF